MALKRPVQPANTAQEAPEPEPHDGIVSGLMKASGQVFRNAKSVIIGGLVAAFLLFYFLSDFNTWLAARFNPGRVVPDGTMVQLWTAAYRLIFGVMLAMAIIALLFPDLFRFLRPDVEEDYDAQTTFRKQLSDTQRLWYVTFLVCFFVLAFVLLLMVRLPETVSVGP